MLTGGWLYVVALVASFVIATVATPAGVSGAVLLLPFQVGVLGTPSPAVTPTNLLYNVVATPGALFRYRRQHQTGGQLTAVLLIGTVPGVVAGSIIRVLLLPGARVFEVVIAAVLIPLGGWLLLRPTVADGERRPGQSAVGAGVGDGRGGRRLCGRDLRHRGRLYLGSSADRVGTVQPRRWRRRRSPPRSSPRSPVSRPSSFSQTATTGRSRLTGVWASRLALEGWQAATRGRDCNRASPSS